MDVREGHSSRRRWRRAVAARLREAVGIADTYQIRVTAFGALLGAGVMAYSAVAGDTRPLPSAVCVVGFAAGSYGLFRLARWADRPHSARVSDVRPIGLDEFQPYFIATCDCGWVGTPSDAAAAAFQDARRHTSAVAATIERPVG